MAVSTSLQCPHCGYSTKTTKLVLPNARIRCPKCKSVFQILASPDGLVESIPVADEPVRETLLEVTAAGGGAMQPRASGGLQAKYLPETALPPPPRTPAPTPTTVAKPALATTPPPFRSSRTVLAIIGGTAVAVAVGAFAFWYYSTVKALTKSADTASAQLTAKYKAPIGAPVGAAAAPLGASPTAMPVMKMPSMVGASLPASAGSPAPSPTAPTRTEAPNAVQIGDLNVSLVSGHLGRLNRAISGEYLSLRVKVTNRSRSPINFASWGRAKVPVILKDKEGNFYSIARAAGDDNITIAPGKSYIDTLLFEATPPYTQLDLDLPIAGTDGAFQFHTPSGFVVRATVPLEELPPIAEASPAAPPKLPPEKDPEVRKAIIIEYQDKWAAIVSRAKGQSFNEGNLTRRRGQKALIKQLGDKYKLDEDKVKMIVREGR